MRAKKKKQELAYFIDIQKKRKVDVIDLRNRTQIIKWLLVFIALIIGGWLFYAAVIKADVSYFYPHSALGTWQNINRAAGQPDLDFQAEASKFNETNSAIFEGGGIKQIFLGNFQGQLDNVENKKITSATLKINWVFDDKRNRILQQSSNDIIILEPTPTIFLTPPPENLPTNETTTLENSSETALPTTESSPTATDSSAIPESPTISETPLPTTELSPTLVEPTPFLIEPTSSSTPTPLSFWRGLIKKVFAQELTETPAPIPTPTSSENPTSTPTETANIVSSPTSTETPSEAVLENSITPTEITIPSEMPEPTEMLMPNETSTNETPTLVETPTSIETSSSAPSFSSAPLFEIRYSFDNTNWQTLAQISYENFQKEFEIPLENWEDIANLQIVIESTLNTNLDENLIAFLDGVALEIKYETPSEAEETLTPSVELTPSINPQIEEFLKLLSQRPLVDEKEFKMDVQVQHSCSVEPFNTTIHEGEIQTVQIKLNKNPKSLLNKLKIGKLPNGIEMFFEKNVDYSIQPEANENTLSLKIMSLPNSQKGNFSIPIIYESDGSSTICQINVVNF